MESEKILPAIDLKILQEKATEFAMKGAIESIKEYYSGYNSPFRKAIDQELSKKSIGTGIDLPDIIALINQSLSKEIDSIANTAIAKTFLPLVQTFLVREDKEIKFSDILRKFVELTDAENIDDCSVYIQKDVKYSWLDVEIIGEESNYKFTLHEDYAWKAKKDGSNIEKYCILSLPYDWGKKQHNTMKLTIGDGILEMPFTKDILADNFISYIARLVIGKCSITIDAREFSEDMFPDHCRCD